MAAHHTPKQEAIKAAKDLGYGSDIVNKLKKAKNEAEIQRIMITARKEHFK